MLVVTGAAVLTYYGYVIKAGAEALLKDLTALEVGRSTGSDAQQVIKRHERFLVTGADKCSDHDCTWTFNVQNKWLSAVKLEPIAQFKVEIKIKNGIVDSVGAYLFRSMPIFPTFGGSAGLVDEYVEYPKDMRSPDPYEFATPVGKPYLFVILNSHASSIQKEHAFGFSFRCLVKPGWGCNLPCDYLPAAWEDWKTSLKESPGYSQLEFEEHYPNNSRCEQR